INASRGKGFLVSAENAFLLPGLVDDKEGLSLESLLGHAHDPAEGVVHQQDGSAGIRQAHAIGGVLPDQPETGAQAVFANLLQDLRDRDCCRLERLWSLLHEGRPPDTPLCVKSTLTV